MKAHSRLAWLIMAAATATLSLSCMTPPRMPLRDNVAVKRTAYGSPSDSVLVYGSAAQMKFLFGAGLIENLEMIQLNPAQKPMIITPARNGYYFFTEPLPVGSSVRIFYFSIQQGRTITFYYRGLQGNGPADIKLQKPGLLYLGSLVYATKAYADKHSPEGVVKGYDSSTDLYPVGDQKEIDTLKAIRPKFEKTNWEPIIAARIEELKK
jgi:hypothetical protein